VLSCVPTAPTAALASTLTLLEAAREEWAEPAIAIAEIKPTATARNALS
jgi:hypothetical protein